MTSPISKSHMAVLAAAIVLAITSPITVNTAIAYDDDVEVVCGDTADGGTFCVSVDDLMAECPLFDPEYTTAICQGLLHGRPTAQGSFFAGNGNSDGGNIIGTGKRPGQNTRG